MEAAARGVAGCSAWLRVAARGVAARLARVDADDHPALFLPAGQGGDVFDVALGDGVEVDDALLVVLAPEPREVHVDVAEDEERQLRLRG